MVFNLNLRPHPVKPGGLLEVVQLQVNSQANKAPAKEEEVTVGLFHEGRVEAIARAAYEACLLANQQRAYLGLYKQIGVQERSTLQHPPAQLSVKRIKVFLYNFNILMTS